MAFDAALSTAIIAVYMLMTLGIGLYAWRLQTDVDMEGYTLANRAVHWFVGFFSTAASQFSALTFMGFIAFYFNFGISAFIAICGAYLFFTSGLYYFMGTRIWKVGRKFDHITPSDTVRDYYDSELLGYVVAVGMILALIPYLEVQFLGVGILLKLGTGGLIPITTGAVIIAAVIAVYTWLGGMKSVAWVDTVQGVMLLGGTFLGGLVLLFTVGEGFGPAYDELLTQAPAILSIPGAPGVFTWPFIVSFSIAVFLGWVFHPHMWMRVHYFESGKAVQNLPWVTGGIFWLTQMGGWFVVLAGVLTIPNASPDQFLLLIYRRFFPTALFALVISAALAAMMSSASSQCHGIGSVVSRDLSQRLKPEWSEARHVFVARIAMLAGIVGAVVLSTFNIKFLLTSGAASAALATSLMFPQTVAALYGFEWPTREGAIAGSFVGAVVALAIFVVPQITSPLGLYGGIWGLAANVAVFVVGSLVTDTHPDRSTIESWMSALDESFVRLDREHRERQEPMQADD